MASMDNRLGGSRSAAVPAVIVGLCLLAGLAIGGYFDESGPFSPTSTPVKRIRVVSTFEFELR